MHPSSMHRELRARLDPREVAEHEGLGRRGRDFDCAACGRRLKARSKDGEGWFCVACDAHGDAVDVIRLCRGLDSGEAIRVALDLAGLGAESTSRPGDVWKPRPRVVRPELEPLAPDDEAARLRAVGLAALHYTFLAGVAVGKGWVAPLEHVDYLATIGAFDRRRVHVDGTGRRRVSDVEHGLESAIGYLRGRMGASWEEAQPVLAALVGVCPSVDSGLRGFLRSHGGAELVGAAERAGIFRRNGVERFAGRLVYFWTNGEGRVRYLTGRAVPGLVDVCGVRRDEDGTPIKGEALPVFNPARRDDRLGVPAPACPFGAHLALAQEGPMVIVEGELDAVHELVAGPAVATGGSARMGNVRGHERLRVFLDGRDAIVAFDREETHEKQGRTDRRACELAHAIGARWAPGEAA